MPNSTPRLQARLVWPILVGRLLSDLCVVGQRQPYPKEDNRIARENVELPGSSSRASRWLSSAGRQLWKRGKGGYIGATYQPQQNV